MSGWVRRYRQEGVRGLMNQPLRGKQADEEKAALIRQYRAAGKKITQIVVLVNVCRATVNRVLNESKGSPID